VTAETTPREALAAETPPDSGPLRSPLATAALRAAEGLLGFARCRSPLGRLERRPHVVEDLRELAADLLRLDRHADEQEVRLFAGMLKFCAETPDALTHAERRCRDIAAEEAQREAFDAETARIDTECALRETDGRGIVTVLYTAPPREPAEVAT
jgi:hypothetical protein